MKSNPVPWVLLVIVGIYAGFFTNMKKYDDSGKEIVPTYTPPAPLVEEKHDPEVIQPVSGMKVLRFWDKDQWRYVGVPPAPGMDVKSIISNLTGLGQ